MSVEAVFENAPEVIRVDSHRVACDGGGGALGHPITWYEMGDEDFVCCKYCGRVYVIIGSEHDPERGAA